MYSVGELVREARRRRGWGQRRLAEASGVAQANLAAIETGARTPSLAMVARLVRACGLQVRFDLEPRHADVDAEIAARLDRPPLARVAKGGVHALITATRLVRTGVRLVVDGPLAAQLLGAPAGEAAGAERIWCDHANLDQLRQAAARCYLDVLPVRPRYLDPVLRDGDQVRIGACTVTVGTPPPAPDTVAPLGTPLPVVTLDRLLAYPDWTPADRVAVRRLAERLDRDEAAAARANPGDI
jgi:transcriptional regulator with XRE-family HTH domain